MQTTIAFSPSNIIRRTDIGWDGGWWISWNQEQHQILGMKGGIYSSLHKQNIHLNFLIFRFDCGFNDTLLAWFVMYILFYVNCYIFLLFLPKFGVIPDPNWFIIPSLSNIHHHCIVWRSTIVVCAYWIQWVSMMDCDIVASV